MFCAKVIDTNLFQIIGFFSSQCDYMAAFKPRVCIFYNDHSS